MDKSQHSQTHSDNENAPQSPPSNPTSVEISPHHHSNAPHRNEVTEHPNTDSISQLSQHKEEGDTSNQPNQASHMHDKDSTPSSEKPSGHKKSRVPDLHLKDRPKEKTHQKSRSKNQPLPDPNDDLPPQNNELDFDDAIAYAVKWLAELFVKMALKNVSIDVSTSEENQKRFAHFNLSSTNARSKSLRHIMNSAKSISRTIESIQLVLQELVDRIAKDSITVEFDIDGYLQRRTQKFQHIANDLAGVSAQLNRPIVIAGLSSFDRRVVHNTLAQVENVSTNSLGQGSFRKLCVEPK